jgi:hypothetical protein
MAMIDWFWVHPDIDSEYRNADPTSRTMRQMWLGLSYALTAAWALLSVLRWSAGDVDVAGHAVTMWAPLVLAAMFLASNAALAADARRHAAKRDIPLHPVYTHKAVAHVWTARKKSVAGSAAAMTLAVIAAWGGHTGSAYALALSTLWVSWGVVQSYVDQVSYDRRRGFGIRDLTDIEMIKWYSDERYRACEANQLDERDILDEAVREVDELCGRGTPLGEKIETAQTQARKDTGDRPSTNQLRRAAAAAAEEADRAEAVFEEIADELEEAIQIMAEACEDACISPTSRPGMSLVIAKRMVKALRSRVDRGLVLRPAIIRAVSMSKSWHIALGRPTLRREHHVSQGDTLDTKSTFDVGVDHYVGAVLSVLAERVTPTYLEPATKTGDRLIPARQRKDEAFDPDRWNAAPTGGLYRIAGKMLTADERASVAEHIGHRREQVGSPRLSYMLDYMSSAVLMAPEAPTDAQEPVQAVLACVAGRQ